MNALLDVIPTIMSSITWVDIVSILVLPFLLPSIVGWVSTQAWPTLAKRLSLGVLSLLGVLLTGLVDAVANGQPFDIGITLLQFAVTWYAGEKAYEKILKAPITAAPTLEIVGTPVDASKMTKAQLVELVEQPASIELTAQQPTSIASIIQSHGRQAA
jgi:hypothetical protein